MRSYNRRLAQSPHEVVMGVRVQSLLKLKDLSHPTFEGDAQFLHFLVVCKLLKYASLQSRACVQRDIVLIPFVNWFLYCTYRLAQTTTWSVKYAESDQVKIISTNEYDYGLAWLTAHTDLGNYYELAIF